MNAIRTPATRLPIVRWLAKPITSADHRRRREDAAGDRAHLRDHEQRREDADEDDRREDRAPEDAVAGRDLGRERAPRDPPVDELRDSRRDGDHGERRSGRLCQESDTSRPIRPSRSVSGLRSPRRARASRRRSARRRASRAATSRPWCSAGKSSRPRSRSLTATPSASSSATQAPARSAELLELRLRRVQVAGRVAAAVPTDRGHERSLRPDELAHPRAHLDEPLGGGAHLVERAVSLGWSEDAFGHGAAFMVGAIRRVSRSGSPLVFALIALQYASRFTRRRHSRRSRSTRGRLLRGRDRAGARVPADRARDRRLHAPAIRPAPAAVRHRRAEVDRHRLRHRATSSRSSTTRSSTRATSRG